MTFQARNAVSINAHLTGPQDLGNSKSSLAQSFRVVLGDGTGTDQADLMFADAGSISDGGQVDIDLTSITDAFGQALGAVHITEILIVSDAANTTDVTVGGSGADYSGIPDQVLSPGGLAYHANPKGGLGAVANGSSDIIRLDNAAGAVANYNIYISGRSA